MKHGLQTGCLALGVLCFLYYMAIILYAGITADFAWIWLFGTAFFLTVWKSLKYIAGHPDSWLRLPVYGALVLFAAVLIVILVFGGKIVMGMYQKPPENLDCVIVLGAQVRGEEPSRALRKRLDRALDYAEQNPDTVFLLSGGKGDDEDISEAECMYRYLTEHGMKSERLLREDRSTSTRENLRFSAEFLDKERDRIGLLSNNFHIYRALDLAHREGYRNVSGIPAPSDPGMQPHYVLREICALLAGAVTGR